MTKDIWGKYWLKLYEDSFPCNASFHFVYWRACLFISIVVYLFHYIPTFWLNCIKRIWSLSVSCCDEKKRKYVIKTRVRRNRRKREDCACAARAARSRIVAGQAVFIQFTSTICSLRSSWFGKCDRFETCWLSRVFRAPSEFPISRYFES